MTCNVTGGIQPLAVTQRETRLRGHCSQEAMARHHRWPARPGLHPTSLATCSAGSPWDPLGGSFKYWCQTPRPKSLLLFWIRHGLWCF